MSATHAGPPLRVLLVSPDFPPQSGGVQILMARLAEHLPDAAVRVVTFDVSGAEEFDRSAGLDVRRVRRLASVPKLRIAALAGRALAEARAFRCDVVLVSHVAAFPAGVLTRRVLHTPWVLYVHADEFRVWPSACARAVRRADAVVAVSQHSAELAKAGGATSDRLHVILNGVDMPAEASANHAQTQPTVVTVARMVDSYKGHDVMLRALPLIVARVPDVRWVVVGDGPLRADYEQQAASLGITQHVSFEGNLSDGERDQWLRRADVFAMPARLPSGGLGGEGFGIAFLEAAAYGVPVVGGAEGGAVDAVDDGRTGLLVDPRDHVALADAVADLLTDPARARAMGQAGQAWASRFSWPSRGNELSAVLQSVVRPTD